jgi:hypothetical protein
MGETPNSEGTATIEAVREELRRFQSRQFPRPILRGTSPIPSNDCACNRGFLRNLVLAGRMAPKPQSPPTPPEPPGLAAI